MENKKNINVTLTSTGFFTKKGVPIVEVEEWLGKGVKRYSYSWIFSFVLNSERIVDGQKLPGIITPDVYDYLTSRLEKMGFKVYLSDSVSGVQEIVCKYELSNMDKKFDDKHLLTQVEVFAMPECLKMVNIRGPYHNTDIFRSKYTMPIDMYYKSCK